MRALILCLTLTGPVMGGSVTFSKDVLPILQKNCQMCHRPGEIGPMSLLTYTETRPWAKAIKAAVLTKKMPPWFADPRYGHFSNDRRLSDAEVKKLVAWVDQGAPEGAPKDQPAPLQLTEGWNIKPDMVLQMPKPYTVQREGALEYTYFLMPTGFTQDTFVEDAEVRPGNTAVVHHVSVWVRPPGSTWMRGAKPGEPYVPPRAAPGIASSENEGAHEWLCGYLPGVATERYFAPELGAAKMIPAGSDIFIEMHYTASGKAPEQDQTKVGLVFSKKPPKYRLLTLAIDNDRFVIPPGDPNYEGHATATFTVPVILVYLEPHMHLRGKDMQIDLEYPDGDCQTVLRVTNYSYLWQTIYREEAPIPVPKGTRVEVTAHWDNSANNPLNPDPSATVRFGIQSWDEMLNPLLGVLVEIKPREPGS